ncbi:hypothetical protein GCM10010433_15910 [Streptomyces pulveraceus]|uniref:Uncharacterized protein n=1 Tax=Streptomyces pulveraceus TaxID=68258 RepID=A0ABW1GE55_9ACTN
MDLFPAHGFNIYGEGDRAHVELVSSAVDVTERSELALCDKAFAALSGAASYGDGAEELLGKGKAHSFWADAPLREWAGPCGGGRAESGGADRSGAVQRGVSRGGRCSGR